MLTDTLPPPVANGSANQARDPQPAARCSWWQRTTNRATQYFKGEKAALMRAAGNNDVTTIKRILSARSCPDTVNPNIRHGKKNRTPAIKAASHGHVEALRALLEFGASAKDVMTLTEWQSEYPLGCGYLWTRHGFIEPILYYTPQIIKTLLEDYDADPNTPYGIATLADTDMTSLEHLNLTSLEHLNMTSLLKNWDPDKTEPLCLQFARHPKTNLNGAIDFDKKTFFPWVQGIKKLKFPDFPTTPARINLLGQAFLFNNTSLIRFLLTDDRVNPASPHGSAENLIVIVVSKVRSGYYCNFIPALKAKLLSSRSFYDVLIHHPNTRFRQDFLDLIEISQSNRYLPFISCTKGIDRQEQDRKIAALYPAFQPDSGGALYPGKKNTS